MAARAGRSFVWPAVIALGITAAGIAYAVPKAMPQAAIIEVQQPSGSINDKVVIETPKAPQRIERPATLQEIGGVDGVTKDYIVHVAKWVGQEMGYPINPTAEFKFLSDRDYMAEMSGSVNYKELANSIGSTDGKNVYIRDTTEPFNMLGLVLNESAKLQIPNLRREGKITLPSGKFRTEIVEAAAFIYQAAAQAYLEENLGFENFFSPPTKYKKNSFINQFTEMKKGYKNDVTSAGFLIAWYVTLNQPAGSEIANTISENKKLSYDQKRQLFHLVAGLTDDYAAKALENVGAKEFEVMAAIIIERQRNFLFEPSNFYDGTLP